MIRTSGKHCAKSLSFAWTKYTMRLAHCTTYVYFYIHIYLILDLVSRSLTNVTNVQRSKSMAKYKAYFKDNHMVFMAFLYMVRYVV